MMLNKECLTYQSLSNGLKLIIYNLYLEKSVSSRVHLFTELQVKKHNEELIPIATEMFA